MICPVTRMRCENSGCTVYIDGRCGLLPAQTDAMSDTLKEFTAKAREAVAHVRGGYDCGVTLAREQWLELCDAIDALSNSDSLAPSDGERPDERYKCRQCGTVMGGNSVSGVGWHIRDGRQCGPVDLRDGQWTRHRG